MAQHDTDRGRGAAEPDSTRSENATAGASAAHGEFEGALGSIRQLGEEIGAMLRECVRLAGAESRLFAISLLLIIVLGVALGFMLAGALLLLATAAIVLLMVHGEVDPVLSVLSGFVLVCLLAGALLLWMRRRARDLRFEQTRAALADVVSRTGESSR